MTIKEQLQRCGASVVLRPLLHYVAKNPGPNLVKLVELVDRVGGGEFPEKTMTALKKGALDEDNVWVRMATNLLRDTDKKHTRQLLMTVGLGALNGTKLVRANREKYNCNIPFQILFDPTSACNLKCKGCWAGEYDKHNNLSLAQMDDIVRQAKALGTRMFMLTGGEPLMRADDVLTVARKHRECYFVIYTNATLLTDELVKRVKKCGNITFAISMEGTPESNDARRGKGAYLRSVKAMERLQNTGLLFGISVCYTRDNIAAVTSDAFMQDMIARGVRFGLYFQYMPVGAKADVELIPTPAQREEMYHWLRRTRNGKTGNPMFVMDFQNDGAYVGGCIAAGRNYFHINAAGDIEPCVFIHYADSNIREHTLLEALQRPLFQAFYKGQPFCDNHLKPCPMLENPHILREMVNCTGACSTDQIAQEDVETLCSKCDAYAADWHPVAERIWAENPQPKPKTQYYAGKK
ncbi:MAG: radical SAM protein [Oscillospiraceae bacterium]|nr:radical SAM protein [Oscillospiraceae bacterium]